MAGPAIEDTKKTATQDEVITKFAKLGAIVSRGWRSKSLVANVKEDMHWPRFSDEQGEGPRPGRASGRLSSKLGKICSGLRGRMHNER